MPSPLSLGARLCSRNTSTFAGQGVLENHLCHTQGRDDRKKTSGQLAELVALDVLGGQAVSQSVSQSVGQSAQQSDSLTDGRSDGRAWASTTSFVVLRHQYGPVHLQFKWSVCPHDSPVCYRTCLWRLPDGLCAHWTKVQQSQRQPPPSGHLWYPRSRHW